MPSTHESSTSTGPLPRSRTQFWILIILFFAPLAIAFLLYYGGDGWRPAGNTNHGELIQPPRPIPQLPLTTPDGSELPADTLRGKWTLAYIGSGECDARCREALTLMRQTRIALNDDMPRVQRLFLVWDACCDQAYLQTEHADLLIALLGDANGQQIKQLFQGTTSEPVAQAGRIYIVDPLGNLMMSYPPTSEPKGLLEDLKKLLKFSHIG
jgi:cytochrome oxidase Cu insertion factor (SCO1/SenC/PrrC family)